MIRGFSKKEHEYIAAVLAGRSNIMYSSSYSCKLRSRCLEKVLQMGSEILLFNKAYILEYDKLHRFNWRRQIIDEYYDLVQQLRNLPRFPSEAKKDNDGSLKE